MSFTRLHPVPLAAGLIVAVLTLLLGNWQVRRAAEKADLQVRIEAGAAAGPVSPGRTGEVAEWRPVSLRGEWQAGQTIYLDNRVLRGRVGYHVLTPLRLADGDPVLVNRGWIAGTRDRRELPPVASPPGPVELAGTVRVPEAHPFTLADEPGRGRVWQYLDLARYRESTGLPVRDWIVQQTSDAADGLVRDWPRPDAGIDRHRGYALQWYSLAGLSFVMTAAYVIRRLAT